MIKLYPYQEEYIKHVKPNFLYDMDTGTGKTIMGLEHHKRFFGDCPLLIVAPASKINEGGWQRTIEEHYKNIKEYKTCSYHKLEDTYNELEKSKELKNYFVIFDECHRLKQPTGVWGKAGINISKKVKGFILLSATPIPNGWKDAMTYFIMFKFVKNKTAFMDNYAITVQRKCKSWYYTDIIGWKDEEELTNKYLSISRRLNKSDAKGLPDLVFDEKYFKVSINYKKILRDRVLGDVEYDTIMKLRHGLRLNCNLEDKISYITDFIEDTKDNIVIFYNYVEEYKALKKAINKKIYVCNGEEHDYPKKSEWDNVENTVTLANYKSGSEAVEFTYANIIIYFSPTDSYTEYYQSYGRCYRNGQKKKVTVYKLITQNSVEEDIYNSLLNKEDFNFDLWEKSINKSKKEKKRKARKKQ